MLPKPLKKNEMLRTLLTVKDVAQLDSCSEKTVRRAITAGLLEVVRVGPGRRLLRIDPAAHAAYRQASRW
jgi:excisionase family DNA binding protein